MTTPSGTLVWHEGDVFSDFFALATCCDEANEYRINEVIVAAETVGLFDPLEAGFVKDGEIIEVTARGYKTLFSPLHGPNVEIGVFDNLDAAKAACAQHHRGQTECAKT